MENNINYLIGFINNNLALRRLIINRNGKVLQEKEFGHAQGFTLQLILAGKNIEQSKRRESSYCRCFIIWFNKFSY